VSPPLVFLPILSSCSQFVFFPGHCFPPIFCPLVLPRARGRPRVFSEGLGALSDNGPFSFHIPVGASKYGVFGLSAGPPPSLVVLFSKSFRTRPRSILASRPIFFQLPGDHVFFQGPTERWPRSIFFSSSRFCPLFLHHEAPLYRVLL